MTVWENIAATEKLVEELENRIDGLEESVVELEAKSNDDRKRISDLQKEMRTVWNLVKSQDDRERIKELEEKVRMLMDMGRRTNWGHET